MAEVINPSAKNTINQTKSQSSLRLPLGAIKATKKLTIRKTSAIRSAAASCVFNPFYNPNLKYLLPSSKAAMFDLAASFKFQLNLASNLGYFAATLARS